MESAAQHQERVDRHFKSAANYWQAVYREGTVHGAIYQERKATALEWIDALALPGGTAVLEIGCGAGLTSVALAERGFIVAATDSLPAMIRLTDQLARDRNLAGRIRTSVVDAHCLPFEACSYSIVLALGVLPWLHSPDRAVEEIARVLRPGGFVLLSVDNIYRLHYWLDPRLNPALAPALQFVRRGLRRTGIRRSPMKPTLVGLDSPRRINTAISCAGLDKLRDRTIGFGPFTFWGRRMLSEQAGVRLHRKLQNLADRNVPVVRGMGAQYLVLARKPYDI